MRIQIRSLAKNDGKLSSKISINDLVLSISQTATNTGGSQREATRYDSAYNYLAENIFKKWLSVSLSSGKLINHNLIEYKLNGASANYLPLLCLKQNFDVKHLVFCLIE